MTIRTVPSKAATRPKGGRVAARASVARSNLKGMAEVVKNFEGLCPAADLIREVTVVPTIFPYFDWRVDVGGLPVGSIALVHGPSAEGKTPFVIGLGRSFLEGNHFFNWIDAEYSTPATWMKQQLGPYYNHIGFTAPKHVGTYEHVRSLVRRWCDGIGEARIKGLIDDDTTGVCVVDSISQLIPESAWDEMRKSATPKAEAARAAAKEKPVRGRRQKPKGHIDGAGGRLGQIQAGYNAIWVKELGPLLYETRTSMVVIARETLEEGEGMFADDVVHVGGGRHLKYGSGLWLRAVSDPVWQKKGDEKGIIVGHKHTIEIRRSKVGPRREKMPVACYHTSNGAVCPEGFDRARDVLELATDMTDVLTMKGSNYYFTGEHLGNGVPATLERLRAEPELCATLERECRSRFVLPGAV